MTSLAVSKYKYNYVAVYACMCAFVCVRVPMRVQHIGCVIGSQTCELEGGSHALICVSRVLISKSEQRTCMGNSGCTRSLRHIGVMGMT